MIGPAVPDAITVVSACRARGWVDEARGSVSHNGSDDLRSDALKN